MNLDILRKFDRLDFQLPIPHAPFNPKKSG